MVDALARKLHGWSTTPAKREEARHAFDICAPDLQRSPQRLKAKGCQPGL
jgi:hypothetical protein